MTVQWYYRRIRKLLAELTRLADVALPANRSVLTSFLLSDYIYALVDILSGLKRVDEWEDVDWENHSVFSKFRQFVVDSETKMERGLRSVRYCLDEANTLTMVAGGGRPEKVRQSFSLLRGIRTNTTELVCPALVFPPSTSGTFRL